MSYNRLPKQLSFGELLTTKKFIKDLYVLVGSVFNDLYKMHAYVYLNAYALPCIPK